jgi:hypothetical protein
MTRLLLIPMVAALALYAQEATQKPAAEPAKTEQTAKPAEAAKTEGAAKPEEAAKPEAAAAAAAGEPGEVTSNLFGKEGMSGSIEVGYRWNGTLYGNPDVYRSVVNLGEGPRLFGFDFHYLAPKRGGWLERLNATASGWGGDPYSQLHIDALADTKYRLIVDQRSMAYFNAMPSFANPQLSNGVLFTQDSYDVQNKVTDILLELRPTTRIVPYFEYQRSGSTGRGVLNSVTNYNEYPVTSLYDSSSNLYRGGVHFELTKMHITVEGGGNQFTDNQLLTTSDYNAGNRTAPFLGQTLFLNNVQQQYNITGNGPFLRALFTYRPWQWIDVYANLLYSQPETTSSLNYLGDGNFVQNNPILFYSTSQYAIGSAAAQPHTTGNAGFELRPHKKIRVVETFLTDRLHTAGVVDSITGMPAPPQALGIDRLNMNYNQNIVEVIFDVSKRLTVRGGDKYMWGDSLVRAPELASDLRLYDTGQLGINAGLAGFTYRITSKFNFSGDAEIARGNNVYFATSLKNYNRATLRASYRLNESLQLGVNYVFFNNSTPTPEHDYQFESQTGSLSLQWTPRKSKYFNIVGEYARVNYWSNTTYYMPQTLQLATSAYNEVGNSVTGLVDVRFWNSGRAPRIAFGGSMWYSSGTRGSQYYQPMARFTAPVVRHLDLNAEWRWYSLNEPQFAYENFRQNQFIVSVRLY